MSNCTDFQYRVSIQALILDDVGRFLLTKEASGMWELPDGGLEHGEAPQHGLTRDS